MAIKEGGKLNGIAPSNHIAAIIPSSFDDALRIARLALTAGLYKQEGTGDNRGEAQATMAILKGMEIGIPPMQALENITIINGRSCIWGDLVPALLWSNGFDIDESYENEDDDIRITAICVITRPGGKKVTRKFSAADAKEAKLLGKAGPWTQFRKRMLQMRARGYGARDGAADVLKGLYLREEIEDLRADEARDITPKRSMMIPSADFLGTVTGEPQRTADDAQAPAPEDLQDAIPEDPKALLEELRLALTGAHTKDEVETAWDEMAERLRLAGQGVYNQALGEFDKRVQELQVPHKSAGSPEIPASDFIAPKSERTKLRIPSAGGQS
jgi:hypothetical protein